MIHTERQGEQYVPPPRGWKRNFLILSASLASTILLKAAGIQYLEYIYFFQILYLIFLLCKAHLRTHIFRPFVVIAACYLFFAGAAMLAAFASLRDPFYFPSHLSLLRYPVIITISRIAELAADVTAMLYLANEFRKEISNAIFAIKIYFWVGVASAAYSILTYPLNVLFHIELGTYLVSNRMRGFYNEGGPYGNYAVSVLLVGLVLYARHWEHRRRLLAGIFLVFIALLGSQSKASVLVGVLVFFVNAALERGAKVKIVMVGSLVLFVAGVTMTYNFSAQTRAYQLGAERYERASHKAKSNLNLVAGRTAGLFLVPRMIQQHPYLGVGWGNYGIVRNAPEYRAGSVWVDFDDTPGLGLLGTAAEVGVPLTLLLSLCLTLPYIYLRRLGAPLHLKCLALLQPAVHIFGAQLNVTYPWVTTALALGIAFARHHPRMSQSFAPDTSGHQAGIL